MINPTQEAPRPKRRVSVLVLALVAGAALIFGVIVGGVAGGTTDEPPATAQPAVVASAIDTEKLAACQRSADELYQVAQSSIDDIASPQGDVIQMLITQLQGVVVGGVYALDTTEIDRGTAILDQVVADTEALTARVDATRPDFQACVG